MTITFLYLQNTKVNKIIQSLPLIRPDLVPRRLSNPFVPPSRRQLRLLTSYVCASLFAQLTPTPSSDMGNFYLALLQNTPLRKLNWLRRSVPRNKNVKYLSENELA